MVKKYGILLILFFSFGAFSARGQYPYSIELVNVVQENGIVIDTLGAVPKGGAVYVGGSPTILRFKKNPDFKIEERLYVTVLDFQPNGQINQIYPTPFKYGTAEVSINDSTPESWQLPTSVLNFAPPYGKERFVVLYSRIPLTLLEADPFNTSKVYYRDANANPGKLSKVDIEWILGGSPPEYLRGGIYHYELDFEIRPLSLKESEIQAEVVDEIGQPPSKSGSVDTENDWGDAGDEWGSEENEETSHVTESRNTLVVDRHLVPNEGIYIQYPVLTFTNPVEPSYTADQRGVAVEEFLVESSVFVVKGTLSCRDKIESVSVTVEWEEEADTDDLFRGRAATTYDVTSFKLTPHAVLFEQQIELAKGTNTVTITAYTEQFGVTQTLLMNSKPKSVETSGQDYLLAIAIDDYSNWPKLKNAVNDADAVCNTLATSYGIEADHIIRLTNAQSTKRGIDSVFRKLIVNLNPEDRIIVYFAGHGYYDDILDEGYWIPVNGPNDFGHTTEGYIPNSTISKYIKSLPTKHTLFLSDACFSGSYCVGNSRGAELYIRSMDKSKSRWIFTSGRMQEVADEYENSGHSPFAYFLLNYLKQPTKEVFTISEMAASVTRSVANNSEQTPMARAIKNSGDEGGEYVFKFTP